MSSTALFVLSVLALLVAGLMVGVEVCVAVFVNPILDRLPGSDGLLGRADGARVLGRVMPFWYGSSVVLAVVLAVVADAGRGPLAASAALFVVSIVMSVALLVPINNQAKAWDAGSAPDDWRERMHRWDRLHLVRLVVITTAFVALAAGVLQAG